MSYGRILADSWAEAKRSVPGRIQEVKDLLSECEAGGSSSSSRPAGWSPAPAADVLGRAVTKMRELELITAELQKSNLGTGNAEAVVEDVSQLRKRLNNLLARSVSTPATQGPIEVARAAQPGRANHPPGGHAAGVGAVAAFLYPSEEPTERENKVVMGALDGSLAGELSRHVVCSFPKEQATVIYRSWTADDDHEETVRHHLALVQVQQAAASLIELSELLGSEVSRAQEHLDQVESSVASAREEVAEAVEVLNGSTHKTSGWVVVSVGLATAALATATLPSASGGILLAVVTRGLIAVGAASLTHLGSRQLETWEQDVIQRMQDQLPRAIRSISAEHGVLLARASLEAQQQLLTKLDNEASWHDFKLSQKAIQMQLPIRRSQSGIRPGGSAWATTFRCDLSAEQVFFALQQMTFSGSLDPECKVLWSRPVENQAGTFVRYLAFAQYFLDRDFFCACRLAPVEAVDSEVRELHGTACRRYVLALSSLSRDLLAAIGLQPEEGTPRARIHICGVAVTDLAEGGSTVQVMADIDLGLPAVANFLVNTSVRLHVLQSARHIRQQLLRQQAPQL